MIPRLDDGTSVVLISIDALRPDMLGFNGHAPSPTPFLDRIASEGLRLKNCFTSGYPTQAALPTLMTSTLPLDYGGYDAGVKKRPSVLAEAFTAAGYKTAAYLAGFGTTPLFGYSRGFARVGQLETPGSWINGPRGIYFDEAKRAILSDDIADETVIEALKPFVRDYLDHFHEYCQSWSRESVDEPLAKHHPRLGRWDWERALAYAKAAREEYRNDPDAFIRRLGPAPPTRLTNKIFNRLSKGSPLVRLLRAVDPGLDGETSLDRLQRLPLVADPDWTKRWWIERVRVMMVRTTLARPSSAAYKKQQIRAWLKNPMISGIPSAEYTLQDLAGWAAESDEPIFAWAHLYDVHQGDVLSWDVNDRQILNQDLEALRDYMVAIRQRASEYDGNLRYDLALRYTDLALERLYHRLEEHLSKPPLLVITADHGRPLDIPNQPDRTGDHVTEFWDEILRIPAVFAHPDLENSSYGGLVSSLDLPVTMLEMVGIDRPKCFTGNSLSELRSQERDFVLTENLGRGPCNFTWKSAEISVRTADRKIICKAQLTGDIQIEMQSAYDLRKDPDCRNPLQADSLPTAFDPLVDQARNRVREIRESMAGIGVARAP